MPVADLFEQAFQTGYPGIAERLGGDHPQAVGLANPFLHLLYPVEARLLLAEARKMLPPDRSGVLVGGAGVNEDQTVLPDGAAGLGEEEREVEVVNGIEGEHAVQGFILERHLFDAGVDRLEIMDGVSSKIPGKLGQHLPADVETGEVQVRDVLEQQPVVAPGAAADIRRTHARPAGQGVADVKNRFRVRGPNLAVDVSHLGEMSGHADCRRFVGHFTKFSPSSILLANILPHGKGDEHPCRASSTLTLPVRLLE